PCTACNSIFYFVGVLNGTLYVQARDFYTVNNATTARMQSRAWAFDGHEWMPQGVALIPDNHAVQYGYQPVQFGNVLVYQSRQPTRTFSNILYVFDGDSVKQADIPATVANFTIDGDLIYVLMSDGQVRRSKDVMAPWNEWEALPTFTFDPNAYPYAPFGHGARSIAVLDGVVSLGTADAELVRLDPCRPEAGCAVTPIDEGP